MNWTDLVHRFVKEIPREIEPATLYVSIEYATAAHLCPGCGRKVVTPFAPGSWNLIFDGEAVSIRPSIRNRAHECRSHYWIDRDRIVPAFDDLEEQPGDGRLDAGRAPADRGAAPHLAGSTPTTAPSSRGASRKGQVAAGPFTAADIRELAHDPGAQSGPQRPVTSVVRRRLRQPPLSGRSGSGYFWHPHAQLQSTAPEEWGCEISEYDRPVTGACRRRVLAPRQRWRRSG